MLIVIRLIKKNWKNTEPDRTSEASSAYANERADERVVQYLRTDHRLTVHLEVPHVFQNKLLNQRKQMVKSPPSASVVTLKRQKFPDTIEPQRRARSSIHSSFV